MEGKYQRGDLIKGSYEKLNSAEVITRGEAMEVMLASDGWKYLEKWMEDVVEINKGKLLNLEVRDINWIYDCRVLINVYQAELARPYEWIRSKNEKLKKEAK